MKASYENQPIMSHSPMKISKKQESEELEYLQAELSALREKKDQLQTQNKLLLNQQKQFEARLSQVDLFSKKENVETYQ